MNPLFFDPRSSRTTVATVLFVWVLVFGTGVARACLNHESAAPHDHAELRKAVPATLLQAPGGVAALLDTVPEREACPHPAALNQSAVVKNRTAVSAVPDVIVVSSEPWRWRGAAAPDRSASLPVDAVACEPCGPPLFLRFLRLTI